MHRKALLHERFIIIIKDVTIMTLGTAAFIAMLLIIGKFMLSRDLQEAAERTNIITSKNQPAQQAIRALNADLQGTASIVDEYTAWSLWLNEFFTLVPPGNQIKDFSVQRDPPLLSLRGKSRTRNVLLQFKANAESSPLFKEIQFPLSNLLLKENIDFEFKASLNAGALRFPPQPSSP